MSFAINAPLFDTPRKLPGVNSSYNLIVSQAFSSTSVATQTLTGNTEYYMPYFWDGGSFESLSIHVQTAVAASNIRLALYRSDGDEGGPGSLIVDAGDVSSATTGMKTASITSTYIGPGWYYTFLNCSDGTDTVVVKAITIGNMGVSPLGCFEMISVPCATIASAHGPAPDPASSTLFAQVINQPVIALGKV